MCRHEGMQCNQMCERKTYDLQLMPNVLFEHLSQIVQERFLGMTHAYDYDAMTGYDYDF